MLHALASRGVNTSFREATVTDMTNTCPKCSTHISLTESLAAPLLKETKARYEKAFAQKGRDLESRERTLRDQQAVV
jgi:hypothetical protein